MLKNGRGELAKPIPEKLALESEYPKNNLPIEYKIGIGDVITYSKLIENNRSSLSKTSTWPKQTAGLKYKLGIGDTLALALIKAVNDPSNATNRLK